LAGPETTEALGALRHLGFLGELPDVSVERLLTVASVASFPRGALCFRATERPSRGGVVLEGLVRVYLEARGGRRLTVRYCRPGDIAGLLTGLAADRAPVTIQAVEDCRMLEVTIEALREVATADAAFAWAVARETSRRLLDTTELLGDATFGTVRNRVARLLLRTADVAMDGTMVVNLTQDAIADGIGSVREVVTRELAAMEREGLLSTQRGSVLIRRPDVVVSLVGWVDRGQRATASTPTDGSGTALDAGQSAT
jgi:CRP-like cAMP-binding protein